MEPHVPEPVHRSRTRAEATVSVDRSEVAPFDDRMLPALVELRLHETLSGDLEGDSDVRALQIRYDDGTATMVSVQRFRGTLGGRAGTFVLQGVEAVEGGRIRATWSVVPRTGTGELAGVRGEGGFEGEFGKGSRGSLDYWFE